MPENSGSDQHGLQALLSGKRGKLQIALDIALPPRGVTALFGPSGAGKTTCLRAIAGLDRDARGSVSLGTEIWQDDLRRIFVPPHRRQIGYVSQDAGLFEHLTVAGNLDYGYRRAGRPVNIGRDSLIDQFGLRALLGRQIGSLSGGERQRVAIVRALLSDPALLLFDEPLSALDGHARNDLLGQLEKLHTQLAVPMIYVSHAIDEVARLADYLLLLEAGRIVVQGTLQDTLTRLDLPEALSAASGTVVEGKVTGFDSHDGLAELSFKGGVLLLARNNAKLGDQLRCRINASDVVLMREYQSGSSALNHLHGRIVAVAVSAYSPQCRVQIDIGGTLLLACITLRSWRALGLAVGHDVWALVKATALGA